MATLNNERLADISNLGNLKLQRVTVNCCFRFAVSREEHEFNFERNLLDHLSVIHSCSSPLSAVCSILFQDCAFNKLQSSSALRVSFQGNTRIQNHSKCNRWYFKFNGNECSGPMTIEAALYSSWPSGKIGNQLYHRSFEGYCENIPQGAVRVELWVGQCGGYTLGAAYTGWNSVSRIIIEEVSRPQS